MFGFRVQQVITSMRGNGLRKTLSLIKDRLKKEGGVTVPIYERWWLSRNGYKPISFVLYEFSEKNRLARTDYLSDRGLNILCHVNKKSGQFLQNKLVFYRFLERITRGFRIPKLLALVRARNLISTSPPYQITSLANIFEVADAVFIKPIDGARGQGVRLLIRDQVNGNPADMFSLTSSPDIGMNEFVIVERANQARYSASISPSNFNTVRVLSMRRPVSREVFIPAAVHRFGTRETAPIDNFSRGGLSCKVDIATGRLGQGKRHPSLTGWRMRSFATHPDTGIRLEGTVIPHWEKLLDNVNELMGIFPDLEFAAWDMLPIEDGWCVIEGNASMDVDLLQVHGGLLADERVREFIDYHCPSALPQERRRTS